MKATKFTSSVQAVVDKKLLQQVRLPAMLRTILRVNCIETIASGKRYCSVLISA